MENSEVNDYLDTLDETVEGTVDESVGSLLGEESGLFVEEVVVPQAPVVSMDTLPITGEARVDDHNSRRLVVVGDGEVAAANQRPIEGLEEARPDDGRAHHRKL